MKWFGSLGVGNLSLAAIVSLGISLPAAADSSEVSENPLGWETNVELLESLEGLDACLFKLSVFPAGGAGYEDSSLPYDEYDPLSAAFMTLRAQTIRANPHRVMDVVRTTKTDALIVDSNVERPLTLGELAGSDEKIAAALATLSEAGWKVTIQASDAPAALEVCEIQNAASRIVDTSGEVIPNVTTPDALTGAVELIVPKDSFESPSVKALLLRHGTHINLTAADGPIEDLNRFNDVAPYNGGNRMYLSGQGWCTNSFRVNGNSTLTADHCTNSTFTTQTGSVLGVGGYSLKSTGLDAQVLYGQTYSDHIWVGGVSTSSHRLASGIYPDWTLVPNVDSLLISGSYSGQGTLAVTGTSTPSSCVTTGWGTACWIIPTQAPGGLCISGDSGGPAGVWDQANNKMIPAGIVKATMGSQTASHICYLTSVATIAYAYGGATIG
jgi:hypothetical protein